MAAKTMTSNSRAQVHNGAYELVMPHITINMFHTLRNINHPRRTSAVEDYDKRILNALFARHLITNAPKQCVKLTRLGKRILEALNG